MRVRLKSGGGGAALRLELADPTLGALAQAAAASLGLPEPTASSSPIVLSLNRKV